MDDAPSTLVRINPHADFVQGELEEANVDDIAFMLGDFDAVADFEGPPPHDERPPREIRQRILERDGDAGRDEAEECGE